MPMRIVDHFLKKLLSVNAAIHNEGEHFFLGPLESLARALDDPAETLAQIGEVVRRLKIDRCSLDGMDEIAVHDFIGKSDFGTPAFEHVLRSGVVLGMGIEVEVGAYSLAQVLLIESPEAVQHRAVSGQPFELLALRS